MKKKIFFHDLKGNLYTNLRIGRSTFTAQSFAVCKELNSSLCLYISEKNHSNFKEEKEKHSVKFPQKVAS